MKASQNTIVFAVVTLLALSAVIYTFTLVNIDAWLMPRIISFLIFFLSVAGLIKSLAEDKKNKDDESRKFVRIFKTEELRPILEMAAWLIGFMLAIYGIGFYPAIFGFSFGYMKRRKRSWLAAVVFSVALTFGLYVLMRYGFSARLYEGQLFLRR